MATTGQHDVTGLLVAWGNGDTQAFESLFPMVYDELRRLARGRLRKERPDHTLSATGLVHEAYLRLVDQRRVQWQNRSQFFALAAEVMRRLLVDYARRRKQAKRGDGVIPVPLENVEISTGLGADLAADILGLDMALTELAALDARKAKLVELRFFGGLDIEETAAVLGVSPGTVMRDWTLAKAWLKRALGGGR
ncbi:MAG: sigma-70 family RNA polymerase sigma factor [Bryobacteraceae bacterium]